MARKKQRGPRFSVRILQNTNRWRAVRYFETVEEAEAYGESLDMAYQWCIYDGRRKHIDASVQRPGKEPTAAEVAAMWGEEFMRARGRLQEREPWRLPIALLPAAVLPFERLVFDRGRRWHEVLVPADRGDVRCDVVCCGLQCCGSVEMTGGSHLVYRRPAPATAKGGEERP